MIMAAHSKPIAATCWKASACTVKCTVSFRYLPIRLARKITEVQVNHHPRKYGKTKYGLERTVKVILDLFTVKFLVSYSSKPIYFLAVLGWL